jgi:hypothetical protein
MNTDTTTKTTEQSNTLSWWEKTHNEAATLAKWMALFEAVNIVAEKAEEKGITQGYFGLHQIYRRHHSKENPPTGLQNRNLLLGT